jgi:hypothetical protein
LSRHKVFFFEEPGVRGSRGSRGKRELGSKKKIHLFATSASTLAFGKEFGVREASLACGNGFAVRSSMRDQNPKSEKRKTTASAIKPLI